MKEEKGSKKSKITKKTNTGKKTTTKKTSVNKKTTPKKVDTTKKSTIEKKAAIIKVDRLDENEQEKILKQKDAEKKNDLILKSMICMAFTVIAALLVIGIGESILNIQELRVGNSKSYIQNSRVLSKSHVIKLDNAKKTFSKLNGNYFIYLSYSGNTIIDSLEREMTELIKSYELEKQFYYVNLDAIINEDNVVDKVNAALEYQDALISKVPTVIYVNKDNIVRIENIITRSDGNMMNIGDFQQLLDINDFKIKK